MSKEAVSICKGVGNIVATIHLILNPAISFTNFVEGQFYAAHLYFNIHVLDIINLNVNERFNTLC